MLNKLTARLLLIGMLFVLPFSAPVSAAEQSVKPTVTAVKMTEKININTASNEQLATIKGIGVKKAQTIIDYRNEHGSFAHVEDLIKVKGIGESTLKKIQPFIIL